MITSVSNIISAVLVQLFLIASHDKKYCNNVIEWCRFYKLHEYLKIVLFEYL